MLDFQVRQVREGALVHGPRELILIANPDRMRRRSGFPPGGAEGAASGVCYFGIARVRTLRGCLPQSPHFTTALSTGLVQAKQTNWELAESQ